MGNPPVLSKQPASVPCLAPGSRTVLRRALWQRAVLRSALSYGAALRSALWQRTMLGCALWTGLAGMQIVLAAPGAAESPASQAIPAQQKGLEISEVYAPPSAAELKAAVLAWIEKRNLEAPPLLDAIAPSWEFEGKPTPEQLFETLMRTFYMADSEVRQVVDICRHWNYSPLLRQLHLPDAARGRTEPLLTHNVRYFLARHLTLLNAYSDALGIFNDIDLHYVVDPAGCLFHRAVCEHSLLMKDEGLATLRLLQSQTESVPLRYRKLAELMQADLEQVEAKSLGEVARQMKDVERRLSLQKTDAGVQQVEEKIVATLDELINKLEEQQQQQQSAASGGGQGKGQPPSSPMPEAKSGGKAGADLPEGQTEPGRKDNWGDLPPKAREAARNMLESEFPAHYRQAVEEYLKKLAERPAPSR